MRGKRFIQVVWGEGRGRTSKSAFDKALARAGIHNFNLIELSSVIPPHFEVIEAKQFQNPGRQRGSRIYVVLSMATVCPSKSEVWVGLGWAYTVEEGGIFVELQGSSEEEVERDVRLALEDMAKYRPYLKGQSRHFRVVLAKSSKSEFSCALIAAIYHTEAW